MDFGIIVGADAHLEWMLPWWWKNYSRYNSFPVAFADFGLSASLLNWCKERGYIISIPEISLSSNKNLEWERIYGPSVWNARKPWFKKPLALLSSPFDIGLWIDIDCEVCAPLNPFLKDFKGSPFAVAREKQGALYNSGVILFQKEATILHEWRKLCLEQNGRFLGDQDALNEILKMHAFEELPPHCNWMMSQGFDPFIAIAHWAGGWGKEYIKKYGGLQK